tara:strand:- start:2146 stop:2472 length:327 start_codon:yes stop_codon:yes gene_type:complete
MKWLVGLVLACCSLAAQAGYPVCWPKQLGSTGSSYKTGAVNGFKWVAWTCQSKRVRTLCILSAPVDYELVHPDISGLTPGRAARAYWDANVKGGVAAEAEQAAKAAFQ